MNIHKTHDQTHPIPFLKALKHPLTTCPLLFRLKQLLVVFHELLSIAAHAVSRIEIQEVPEDGIFQASADRRPQLWGPVSGGTFKHGTAAIGHWTWG